MRYCKIYLLTNKINNKIYVGQTWVSFYERMKNGVGYKGSQLIHNDIQKYGVINFEYTTLKTVDNQFDADYWENYYINEYNSLNSEIGYNLLTGQGALGKHSEATKIKLSQINMGHEVSEETKIKISQSLKGNEPWNKGKNDVYSKETKTQISNSLKGRFHSEEAKLKMSKSKTGITGENAYGAKLTQDQANQIRKDYMILKSYAKVAKKYNVSNITIFNIKKNITYKV